MPLNALSFFFYEHYVFTSPICFNPLVKFTIGSFSAMKMSKKAAKCMSSGMLLNITPETLTFDRKNPPGYPMVMEVCQSDVFWISSKVDHLAG